MFGILIGVVIAIIMIGAGAIYAKRDNQGHTQREFDRHSSDDVYMGERIRNRSGNNRYDKQVESTEIDNTNLIYENGELKNISAILALENIKREYEQIENKNKVIISFC